MTQHYVLIDGENFVHSLVHVLKSQKFIRSRSSLKRFRIDTIVDTVIRSANRDIRYYATRIQTPDKKSDLYAAVERMRKWNAFWVPYIANQGVRFVKAGHLKVRDGKRCPNCRHKTDVLLEKGVDVRLGVDIVSLANKDATIYVFSSDSDLIPAVLQARRNGAKVVYVTIEGSINHAFAKTASRTIYVKKSSVKQAFTKANQ
ncbi:MAG: NYN domain-containing protein [Candidatus Saccharimonadales bacterium]